jgi:hypothetical protein
VRLLSLSEIDSSNRSKAKEITNKIISYSRAGVRGRGWTRPKALEDGNMLNAKDWALQAKTGNYPTWRTIPLFLCTILASMIHYGVDVSDVSDVDKFNTFWDWSLAKTKSRSFLEMLDTPETHATLHPRWTIESDPNPTWWIDKSGKQTKLDMNALLVLIARQLEPSIKSRDQLILSGFYSATIVEMEMTHAMGVSPLSNQPQLRGVLSSPMGATIDAFSSGMLALGMIKAEKMKDTPTKISDFFGDLGYKLSSKSLIKDRELTASYYSTMKMVQFLPYKIKGALSPLLKSKDPHASTVEFLNAYFASNPIYYELWLLSILCNATTLELAYFMAGMTVGKLDKTVPDVDTALREIGTKVLKYAEANIDQPSISSHNDDDYGYTISRMEELVSNRYSTYGFNRTRRPKSRKRKPKPKKSHHKDQ